jgi:pimeloyl-ACP methyl ester carboxylesterase
MKRRDVMITAAMAGLAAALPRLSFAATKSDQEGTTMTTRPQSGYAPVNGVEIYYEIHGTGKPLVLLHGGFGAIEMFGPVLTALAAGHQVIGVDLQAHGRTGPLGRPMTFENMATDVAELIKWLGYDKADVMGYSMGGMTALRLAIDHPEVVDKLVLASTAYAFAGWHDYNQQGMKSIGMAPEQAAEGMKQTPMFEQYKQIAPGGEASWLDAVKEIGTLVGKDFDWSADVPSIKAKTLLVVGDYDGIRISHATKFFEMLGGGKVDGGWDGSGMTPNRFAVLPSTTHYTIFSSPRLAEAAIPFLDGAPLGA